MSDLATLPLPALPAPVEAEMAHAREFALQEKAAATRTAYRSDFRIFATWCQARGLQAVPAAAETVCVFLAAEARAGVKASTIGRRCAAIRYAHRLAGHEPPTSSETVRATLRGIRRSIGTAQNQKAAATADLLRDMLRQVPESLQGKRDRALLLLGFAGAFRRSELVALTVADLTETPAGLRVRIARSKTDQEGDRHSPWAAPSARGSATGVACGGRHHRGAGVPPSAKGGRVLPSALTSRSVADTVKRYCQRAPPRLVLREAC